MVVKASHGPIERSPQLLYRASIRILQGRGMVRGRLWMHACQPRLHQASLVIIAGLVGVYVAEVDLDAGDLILEPAKGLLNFDFDFAAQVAVGVDVVVGIDLNLHEARPFVGRKADAAG